MTEKFDLMYICKQDEPKGSVIYLIARNEKRERKIFRDSNFTPHFWAGPDGPERDIFGRPVHLVKTRLSGNVASLRKTFPYTCEADILFPKRYMISNGLRCGFEVEDGKIKPTESHGIPLLKLYGDIEVKSPPEIMPRASDPKWPIVSFQFVDSYTKKVHLFLLGDNYTPQIYPIKCRLGEFYVQPILYKFSNERQLLLAVNDFIVKTDPDLITFYNGDNFDFPYWFRRARRLGVNVRKLSPFGKVFLHKNPRLNRNEVVIKGRYAIDLLQAYRKYRVPLGDLPTYDFKYVVKLEAGFEYEDFGDRIERIFNTQTLVEYATKDAFALLLLDEAIELFDGFDRLRRIVGCYLNDIFSNKKVIDMWLLRIRDRPLPTTERKAREKYRGAIVLTPQPGVHENVGFFDAKAMYPNLIRSFNLSPEVISEDGDIVIGPMEDRTVVKLKSYPEGLMARAMRMFSELREQYRELKRDPTLTEEQHDLYAKLEKDYKWLAASGYGVFGYPNFRLFDVRIAKAITFLGRQVVTFCMDVAKELGYETIYGDTDGIFVKLRTSTEEEGKRLEAYMNKRLKEYAEEKGAKYPPVVKFERFYRRILFKKRTTGEEPAKKRYAGLLSDGSLIIKGFEPRRSDSAEVTRETMKKWFEYVLKDNDIESAIKLLGKVHRELPTYPVNKVAIPKGLQKQSYKSRNPWKLGVEYSTKHFGYRFREDRKPLLLYVKYVSGHPPTDVVCITEDVTTLDSSVVVDWDKMRQKVLWNKFEPLLEAIGLSKEAVFDQKLTRWIS